MCCKYISILTVTHAECKIFLIWKLFSSSIACRANEIANDSTTKTKDVTDGKSVAGGKPVELKIVTKTKTFHLLNAKEKQ